MLDFLQHLFDTSSFPARWYCGLWSSGLGWLHIGSDSAIFGAYAAIPVTLIYFTRKRRDIPFPPIFWLFAAFIFACGTGHLIEVSIFWHPWYRLAGLSKLFTAVISWMTVVALIRIMPIALEMPGLSKANALLAQEIADRKETVAALRLSEARFQLFVDAIKDHAIFFLSPNGEVASWNAGAERLKGYRAEEILGRPYSTFHMPNDATTNKANIELEIAARDGSYEMEGWRLRKDGSKFWANVLITALRDEHGVLLGFGKVTRDMTDRIRATEQFRLAIEAAPTGMMMVDAGGKLILVNEQIERLFGYSREELLGQSVEMLVPARLRAAHPHLRDQFFSTPKARLMGAGRDLFGVRKDGSEVPIEIALNPLATPDGEFVLSSVADITERKRAEQFRDELTVRLQNANRDLTTALKEREVLLQEVHHRVKNNLQIISSLISMQARKLPSGSNCDAFQECHTRVQTIALIHEKLYQSKNYSRVEFAEYARTLAKYVFAAAGVSADQITLELQIDDVAVGVDRAIPCGLVLNELITNALKHGFKQGERGVIRVELAAESEGMLRLTVKDTGIGLPPNFDIEHTESLGLRLVRTLAGQLDAELCVESTPGAMFQLRFATEI